MGCFSGKLKDPKDRNEQEEKRTSNKDPKIVSLKPFKLDSALTKTQVLKMREEFWDTQPHYGGQKEIWDALKAAVEGSPEMRIVILESAGVMVAQPDLTLFYDERGVKYELPKYLLGFPTNLLKEDQVKSPEVELVDRTLMQTKNTHI
mmetsp:Transcript_9171/g.12440  ORF Transcript_9171/g.12440 Transcript_9171/m.12440 type:complete len:148 (+) Transcript_9171:255-698(+)